MFNEEYADAYAQIHFEKDYSLEVTKLIQYSQIRKDDLILDFGCGSGNHMYELLSLGYRVEGYDMSLDMINSAKKRGIPAELLHSELTAITKSYNLVYSLFDVISYQITDQQLLNFFSQISSVLNPNGQIIFDGWNASGVSLENPEKRIRTFMHNDFLVDRRVTPFSENLEKNIYSLRIELLDSVTRRILTSEIHRLRAWSIDEIRRCASTFGIDFSDFKDGGNADRKLSNDSWRFMARMKRV